MVTVTRLPSTGKSMVLPKVRKDSHRGGYKKDKLWQKRDSNPVREKVKIFSGEKVVVFSDTWARQTQIGVQTGNETQT